MSTSLNFDWKQEAVSAGGAGLIAGAFSYFYMGRQSDKDVWGIEMPHYVADGVIGAISKVTGDLSGGYILPTVDSAFNASAAFNQLVRDIAPSVLTGLEFSAFKKLAVEMENEQVGWIDKWNVLIGVFANIGGDKVASIVQGMSSAA